MKFKIRIAKYYRAMAIQILEQDPSMLGMSFGAKNKWQIASASVPEFRGHDRILYLRGVNNVHDLHVTTDDFEDNEQRNKAYDGLLEALKEYFGNEPTVDGPYLIFD